MCVYMYIYIYIYIYICVCVCMCGVVWCVSVRVCVYVCVYLRPSTVRASSIWISWDTRVQINDVVLKTLDSSAGSLHPCFGMQNLIFQLAALSCSYTRSEHSHDLTNIRLTFRTQDLHSPLSGVALGTHCILIRSVFASALTRGSQSIQERLR